MADAEQTYAELRDDLEHEAHRLKAEIVALANLLEEERQLRPRRKPFDWLIKFENRLAAELGHRNHLNHYLGEWLRR